MYIREKRINRGEKSYSYYQLVEGARDEAGRVRQRVVKHLGPALSKERAEYLARSSGLMCSALSCGGHGIHEHRDSEGWRIRLCEKHEDRSRAGETVQVYPLW